MFIIICLFLCWLICLGSFLASNVSCINSFLFLGALVLRFFFSSLLSSAYSTLSFGVLFVFCRNSFLLLSKLSVSVSSMLFLIVNFWVLFCMVPIDSLRILFIFSINGSGYQICFFLSSVLKGVANFSSTRRSNLSGFCFWIFFSLINFLFISSLALTILWSLPISTLVMTSQFPTIFRSEDMKSIWFSVTPPGAFHVQYLFAAFKKSEFVTTRLFSSAKSRSLSPL